MAAARTITASEASRSVGKLLRAIRQGHQFKITKYGKVIAIMKPLEDDKSE